LLDAVDEFDWRAFRIPPREAKYMDPQQRLRLEVALEAWEDAGVPFEAVAGSRTGVYMAIMWNDYLRLQSRDRNQLNGYSTTGNGFAFAPNRISYTFDLRGPSVAIDSACAGSLAAVHAACQSLWLGEASLALAGGVNLILSPDVNIMLSKAGVLSSAGRCMTLDARADGFVRGEGAGIVVLKPFSQVTASDRVYALIRGGATNHNGHNEWIMAASAAGQEAALRDAYRMAGVDPAAVDYVELHGTGLPKGDPIEAKVLGKVIGALPERDRPCAIGSVKSNIGHLDSAAGIASIIKVALSLHYGQIPPTLHLEEVNPDIPLEALGLVAQQTLGPWPKESGPGLAGVTAISMAGVNAHMVLEGTDPDPALRAAPESSGSGGAYLLPLSARSPEALHAPARAFSSYLNDEESGANRPLRDICFTAGVRRSHHEHRLALIAQSRLALVESLAAFLAGSQLAHVFSSQTIDDQQDISPEVAKVIDRLLGHHDSDGTVEPALMGDGEDGSAVLEASAILYARGYSLAWPGLFPDGGRCVQLPTTPWQRERLWLDWLESPERQVELDAGKQAAAEAAPEQGDSLRHLEDTSANDRRDIWLALVQEQVAGVLGLDQPTQLNPQQGLFDMGLNSLSAVELANRLGASLGRSLPATLVFEYPTVEALTDYLATESRQWEPATAPAPEQKRDGDAPPATNVAELEQLSEEEAEALLLKRLKGL
jgi:acyl transferase domain-containing protein